MLMALLVRVEVSTALCSTGHTDPNLKYRPSHRYQIMHRRESLQDGAKFQTMAQEMTPASAAPVKDPLICN